MKPYLHPCYIRVRLTKEGKRPTLIRTRLTNLPLRHLDRDAIRFLSNKTEISRAKIVRTVVGSMAESPTILLNIKQEHKVLVAMSYSEWLPATKTRKAGYVRRYVIPVLETFEQAKQRRQAVIEHQIANLVARRRSEQWNQKYHSREMAKHSRKVNQAIDRHDDLLVREAALRADLAKIK